MPPPGAPYPQQPQGPPPYQYGPPPQQYGPPPGQPPQYGQPQPPGPPQQQFGPPQQYGQPPGPPQNYGPPPQQYGSPQPPPGYAVPPGPMANPPPALTPAGPGGPPVVLDIGKDAAKKAIIGSSVAGIIGLIAIISGIAGAVEGGTGTQIAVIVVGALFMLPVVITLAMSKKVFRSRLLVLEAAGLRWDDPRGTPFAVPWSELAAVAISKHTPKEVSQDLSGHLAGKAAEKMVGERAHVRLDLYPADPGFVNRHPEMAHLWERQGVQRGYRIPLGSNVKFIPIIAVGIGKHAPQIFRGVQHTEGMMGLS